jgi:hypothetical protein
MQRTFQKETKANLLNYWGFSMVPEINHRAGVPGFFTKYKNQPHLSEVSLARELADNLPGAKIIAAELAVPDMNWIWEVFGLVISFQSYQFSAQ